MLTRSQDLWSGKPVWLSLPSPRLDCLSLKKDISVDVAVIGAGISGALLAEKLGSAGMSVAILDRRYPARGATTASTALLQYEIDVPMTRLVKKIGDDKTARAWRRVRIALDNLGRRIEGLDMACALRRHNTLYLAGDLLDGPGLRREAFARQEMGFDCYWMDRAALREEWGINRGGAIYSHGNMAVNPRRMTTGFLKKAQKEGAGIYAPVLVTQLVPRRDGVDVVTVEGPVIKARAAVVTTGYEVMRQLQHLPFRITASWAMATAPQPRKLWPGKEQIWEASDPYLYIRTTVDGRVLCGGEDEEWENDEKRDAAIPHKTRRLQRKLQKLFPLLELTPTHQWAGCFGATDTGLPLIGPVPGMAHCYAALCFGGNGISFAQVAAEIITTSLRGGLDRDADIFGL